MAITLNLLFNHPRHISLIAQWMYEEWGRFYPDASEDKAAKWVTKTARLSGMPVTMLALDGQNVAGFAMLQRQELYREKGVTPWLGSLLVREGYKGQGIGKRLEQWAATYAQASGYKKLYLLAFDGGSCEWYSRRGWTVYKVIEEKNYSLTVMQKQLGQAW